MFGISRMKAVRAYVLLGVLGSRYFAAENIRYERNLEDYGWSSAVEDYRQKISLELTSPVKATRTAEDVPDPILPKLENNYSDLIPPPTKPRSRRYYQPDFDDRMPKSRAEFDAEKSERIRDYQRPPSFNSFLDDHRPLRQPIMGNTIYGLSGLHRTITADILPEGDYRFGFGFSRVEFDRSFGRDISWGSLMKYNVPVSLAGRISDRFEMALYGNIVNEKAVSFPLLNDFEKTELEEIGLQNKFQFMDRPGQGLKAAFGFGVEHARGQQVTRRGGDGTSWTGFMSVTRDYEQYSLHGQLGYSLASGQDLYGNRQSDALYYNLGMEYAVGDATRLTVEMNGLDWSTYGNTVDVTLGARYRLREEVTLDLFLPFNLVEANLPYEYSNIVQIGASIKL